MFAANFLANWLQPFFGIEFIPTATPVVKLVFVAQDDSRSNVQNTYLDIMMVHAISE